MGNSVEEHRFTITGLDCIVKGHFGIQKGLLRMQAGIFGMGDGL